MKKIPSVFKRDYEGNRLVRDEVVDGCEWVLAGEGVPFEQLDGSACMVRHEDGRPVIFKRYDCKPGRKPPEGWEPCIPEPDPETKHWPGWVRCRAEDPADKYHFEALQERVDTAKRTSFTTDIVVMDGTYELIGPKVQGDPYSMDKHLIVRHNSPVLRLVTAEPFLRGDTKEQLRQWLGYPPFRFVDGPRTFAGIRCFLENYSEFEGIVFHHNDGRMAKIKRKDFGYPWPCKVEGEL